MDLSRKQDITIIGGGVGGCCTALELAKTGKYQVQILEKNAELMKESSDATPGRMGLGFHYADQSTAIYYLHATLDFTKRFGNFRQEIDKGNSHPLRRGRYFIMKNP
jgi:glycine/D-amino acid oxidase-like deaminating enzyme